MQPAGRGVIVVWRHGGAGYSPERCDPQRPHIVTGGRYSGRLWSGRAL